MLNALQRNSHNTQGKYKNIKWVQANYIFSYTVAPNNINNAEKHMTEISELYEKCGQDSLGN